MCFVGRKQRYCNDLNNIGKFAEDIGNTQNNYVRNLFCAIQKEVDTNGYRHRRENFRSENPLNEMSPTTADDGQCGQCDLCGNA